MKPFRQALNEGTPLLFDGAMGTELYRRGLFINRSFEEANLGNRQLIREIHRDYLEAGSDVLSTNSGRTSFCSRLLAISTSLGRLSGRRRPSMVRCR